MNPRTVQLAVDEDKWEEQAGVTFCFLGKGSSAGYVFSYAAITAVLWRFKAALQGEDILN